MNITLYGKQSSLFNLMKTIAIKTASKAHIPLNINEVYDLNELIEEGIMSIPAYQLSDSISERGKSEISTFIKGMQFSILEESNYGQMNRIIVPTNFTKTSDNALNYALHIAKKKQAVIHLVHAYHPSPIEIDSALLDHEIMKSREDQLEKYANGINDTWIAIDDDPLINYHFEIGMAADIINKFSRNVDHGYVVMGSSDDNPLMKNIFGSVSTSVATNANSPVFIIPQDYMYKEIEKIGFCVSDDRIDPSLVKQMADWAHLYNAELHLIHIKQANDELDSSALVKLFSKYYHSELITYKEIDSMNMVDGINIYSEAVGLDLLSMNRKKRGLFGKLFHRSFTKRMTISSRIPLLVVN